MTSLRHSGFGGVCVILLVSLACMRSVHAQSPWYTQHSGLIEGLCPIGVATACYDGLAARFLANCCDPYPTILSPVHENKGYFTIASGQLNQYSSFKMLKRVDIATDSDKQFLAQRIRDEGNAPVLFVPTVPGSEEVVIAGAALKIFAAFFNHSVEKKREEAAVVASQVAVGSRLIYVAQSWRDGHNDLWLRKALFRFTKVGSEDRYFLISGLSFPIKIT